MLDCFKCASQNAYRLEREREKKEKKERSSALFCTCALCFSQHKINGVVLLYILCRYVSAYDRAVISARGSPARMVAVAKEIVRRGRSGKPLLRTVNDSLDFAVGLHLARLHRCTVYGERSHNSFVKATPEPPPFGWRRPSMVAILFKRSAWRAKCSKMLHFPSTWRPRYPIPVHVACPRHHNFGS